MAQKQEQCGMTEKRAVRRRPEFNYSYIIHTLSLKSLSGLSSVCYKTTLNIGGVGWDGAAPSTSKLGTFLSRPLALSKFYSIQMNDRKDFLETVYVLCKGDHNFLGEGGGEGQEAGGGIVPGRAGPHNPSVLVYCP